MFPSPYDLEALAKGKKLAVSVELNEVLDQELKTRVEQVIEKSLGSRPRGEDWKVWIYGGGGYCRIVLKGPIQTRNRTFFYEQREELTRAISEWLDLYPLR